MQFRTVLILIAVFSGAAPPGSAQFGLSSSSNGKEGSITINGAAALPLQVVIGAPWSGRMTSQSVQTLADGTRVTRPAMPGLTTCRDSQGRVRTERVLFQMPTAKTPAPFTLIQIDDPVGGYRYLIDSVGQVAHRMPATPLKPRQPGLPQPPPPAPATRTLPDGTTVMTESLGSQTMSGVLVTGTRLTTTHPAGSSMGNDRPLTQIAETWVSPQLGITVANKSSGQGTDTTAGVEDLSLAEPDPTLFQVPAGYLIVDETGSFTMKIQLRH